MSTAAHDRRVALSVTTVGILAVTLNSSILLISLPAIFEGLGLNPLEPANISYLLWMLMGFLLVTAVLVVTFGRLGDQYGRAKLFNLGFLIFTLGALACAVVPNGGGAGALEIIIARVVQGVGGAMVMANSTALITDAFPPDRRGFALGVNQVSALAGSFFGLIVGGVLSEWHWRAVFWVSVPVGVWGTWVGYRSLHDKPRDRATRIVIDWWGNLTFGLGLIALLAGVLYLSQFRAGLIDARVQSLLVQSEIIAGAIAASATVETDSITIDPDRLLELQAGESYGPSDDSASGIEFPINPERVAPVLRRLVSPTKTRARIYDRDGVLLLDSRNLYGRGDVLRFDLPSPTAEPPGLAERTFIAIRRWFGRGDLPLYKELGPENGKGYTETAQALNGLHASMVRVNDRGEVIVSVAVPVQRFRAVRGALMLSTQGADIDDMVEAERLAIVKVFLVAAGVMIVLSMLLAGTIAGPVRRLAEGAERVRRRIRTRVEIPDFTRRKDEIGHLSGALRDMTDALYSRIEAIESFAADVSHELRNPLTSLRSAVETLPMAKTDANRKRLLDVIEHDVKRLDRLISDISDASRLDAELQRQEAAPVDLSQLLTALVTAANEVRKNDVSVTLKFEGGAPAAFKVPGHDSRIGQVVSNLIDNARSFSPQGGTVRITCRKLKSAVEIIVDDDGPGIAPDAFDKIFERFYTDRPHQGFGQNSGLGLSISQQIMEAHGGTIRVENRVGPGTRKNAATGDDEPNILGARFIVRLPAM